MLLIPEGTNKAFKLIFDENHIIRSSIKRKCDYESFSLFICLQSLAPIHALLLFFSSLDSILNVFVDYSHSRFGSNRGLSCSQPWKIGMSRRATQLPTLCRDCSAWDSRVRVDLVVFYQSNSLSYSELSSPRYRGKPIRANNYSLTSACILSLPS